MSLHLARCIPLAAVLLVTATALGRFSSRQFELLSFPREEQAAGEAQSPSTIRNSPSDTTASTHSVSTLDSGAPLDTVDASEPNAERPQVPHTAREDTQPVSVLTTRRAVGPDSSDRFTDFLDLADGVGTATKRDSPALGTGDTILPQGASPEQAGPESRRNPTGEAAQATRVGDTRLTQADTPAVRQNPIAGQTASEGAAGRHDSVGAPIGRSFDDFVRPGAARATNPIRIKNFQDEPAPAGAGGDTLNAEKASIRTSAGPSGIPSADLPGLQMAAFEVITPAGFKRKVLVVRVTRELLTAEYRLTVDRRSEAAHHIAREFAGSSGVVQRWIGSELGQLRIGGTPIELLPAITRWSQNDTLAEFRLSSRRVRAHPVEPAGGPAAYFELVLKGPIGYMAVDTAEVVFVAPGVTVFSWDLLPIEADTVLTRFEFPAQNDSAVFFVHLPDTTVVSVGGPETYSLAALLSKGAHPSLPFLRSAIPALLFALPFLIFLHAARQAMAQVTGAPDYARLVRLLLFFVLGWFGLYASVDLLMFVARLMENRTLYHFISATFQGVFALQAAFAAVAWPAVVKSELSNPSATVTPTHEIRWGWSATSLGVVSLAGVALVRDFRLRDPSFRELTETLGLLGFAVTIAGIWVFTGQARRVWHGAVAGALAASTALVVAASSVTWEHPAWALAAVALVAPLIYAYLAVLRKLLGWSILQTRRRRLLGTALITIVALGLDALPTLVLNPGEGLSAVDVFAARNVVRAVLNTFQIALVLTTLSLLERLDGRALGSSTRAVYRSLALALCFVFFFSPTKTWFYVPVISLAAWLLVEYFLLRREWLPQPSGLTRQSPRLQKRAIEQLVELNDLRRTLAAVIRDATTKLSKGEIGFATYSERIEELRVAIAELEAKTKTRAADALDRVLACGPTSSAWKNAVIGAMYGFVLGFPWMVMSVREVLPTTQGLGLPTESIVEAVIQLGRWPASGFVLGYFYPHLRGDNGIEKGFAFFLTLTTPLAVFTALTAGLGGESWRGFWLSALQLFIHSMLLGLFAFDVQFLRRRGFRWSYILEVHNLRALAAWASSVLLAIGVATATVVSARAADWVSVGLNAAGLEAPTVESGRDAGRGSR